MGYDIISKNNIIVFWLLLLATLWLLFTLVSKRGTLTRQRRNILTVWAGAQTLVMVVMLALYIFAYWPALPSIASQREPVVDNFFTSLNNGNRAEALALVAPSETEDVAEIVSVFSDPANQPVEWDTAVINKDKYVLRNAVLADGEEVALFLELTWERFEKRWVISRIESGDPYNVFLIYLRTEINRNTIPTSATTFINIVGFGSIIAFVLVTRRKIRQEAESQSERVELISQTT